MSGPVSPQQCQESSPDRVTLYSLMMKPIQRFPQFILLLQVGLPWVSWPLVQSPCLPRQALGEWACYERMLLTPITREIPRVLGTLGQEPELGQSQVSLTTCALALGGGQASVDDDGICPRTCLPSKDAPGNCYLRGTSWELEQVFFLPSTDSCWVHVQ